MKLILIAAFLMATANAAELRITVYDKANLSKSVSQETFAELRRIFRQSKIDVQLLAGDPSMDEASTMTYTEWPRRGHEEEVACRARRDIALDIVGVAPPGLSSKVLGMAQPLARTGLNVRIFNDHVRDAAIRQNRTHSNVLAHAIAHEIGHVLLRSSSHADWGLMSSVWTAKEYGWMTNGGLFFTGNQSRKMLANLGGEGCLPAGLVLAGASLK